MTDVRLTWPGRRPPPPAQPRHLQTLWHVPARAQAPGSARLLAGQALAVLDRLLEEGLAGQVDLAYLDPPFGAGVTWQRKRAVQTADGPQAHDAVAYDDPDDGLAQWLQHLDDVLARVHTLLSPRGSVYVHLDFRRAPHARLLLDERFGAANLKNEIVWSYGLGGSSAERFGRKHDVIQFYAKDPARTWFRAPLQVATSQRMRGQAKRATDVWETADRSESATLAGAWPNDLIPLTLSNSDSQRTGYPTQKPLALLERIVQASLPPGGLALDPMAGSGTLGVAVVRAGGQALLGDRSAVAMDAMRGRLVATGVPLRLEAVDGGLVPRDVAPLARLTGGQVRLLDGPAPEQISAWGVLDRAGVALSWWDGGDQRVRAEVTRQLDAPDGAAVVVVVDVAGQVQRSELAR